MALEQKMIKLMRPINRKYEVDYKLPNGTTLHYEWSPSTIRGEDIREVPEEVFEYLKQYTNVFQLGKLVVVEEEAKEAMDYLMEEAKPVYTSKQIQAVLEGTDKKFKEFLEKVKQDAETLKMMTDVAKTIKLDSAKKIKALAEAREIPVDVLFED